jgi:hypothetical protein
MTSLAGRGNVHCVVSSSAVLPVQDLHSTAVGHYYMLP